MTEEEEEGGVTEEEEEGGGEWGKTLYPYKDCEIKRKKQECEERERGT